MQKYPKRLIEVDLPIKRISAHARREKSIRHGHISTLHIWWARRPLAACRAVICAALWPDPADPLCPDSFRETARALMKKWAKEHLGLVGVESYRRFIGFQKDPSKLEKNEELRRALLDFIADFANWDNSTRTEYLETSRALTQAAHEALGGVPGTRPLVVDPFAGGGSIPLEALRVGADAFASDLNPVAVLLNKVVLEYIPQYGQRLAEEVRKWGNWIKKEAEKELAEFYPNDPDGATPIAYLWARTINCEGPGCGTQIPLLRSLWLAKKSEGSIALRIVPNLTEKRVDFEIIQDAKIKDVGEGTIRRGSATCPVCGYTTSVASVRRQLKEYRGGAVDARLISVRRDDPITRERGYRLATNNDIKAYRKATLELERRKAAHTGQLSLVPDEHTPSNDGHRAVGSPVIYGMETWGDLFTPRQALTLSTFVRLVKKVGKELTSGTDRDLAIAVQTCLALAVDRLADFNSSLCVLNVVGGRGVVHTFGRQALPMVWDFMETNPFNKVGANWEGGIASFEASIGNQEIVNVGHVECSLAEMLPLPDDAVYVFFTDPPYYDAVPYAEIADFFYVWLKRMLHEEHIDLFRDYLTPKLEQTIVWHPSSVNEKSAFEQKMGRAMAEGRRITIPNGIGIIVFAHKSTSGWEAQLQAIINAGWTVTGSWPIDTERPGRINSQGTASLASSIHLVCRPRENPDGLLRNNDIGDWRDILQELPKRIHNWMSRLAAEGVVGADAIFACLGPALEIFSRYSRVEKASGEQVNLMEYLEHVWATVAKEALNMIFEGADAFGFEEDSRLTAMWLWTLSTGANGNGKGEPPVDDGEENLDEEDASSSKQASGGYVLEYDAARKIAQGLGAHLEKLTTVVEIKGDKARLLPVTERARFLFGKYDGQPAKKSKKVKQLSLFEMVDEVEEEGGWGDKSVPKAGETILDRLHQSMILFAAGRGEALKRFLVEEGIGRDQRFWRLAQALSALYPTHSDEKRWVDGVLARKKGLGF
ncbi:MAG: DUF1156 domain-containing protein [Peptococcaceae bacterium]|nr:DUF1156 domain-containing protein [Peptococcaceae bacterium]